MVSKESEYLMKTITTAEQFNELINGNQKVLVKFYAGWCPDCTRMNMFIDPIIEEYANAKTPQQVTEFLSAQQ